MKTSINLTTSTQDVDRFAGRDELKAFYTEKGISGLELMLVGSGPIPDKIPLEDLNGVHLSYFPCWFDFWNGNREALQEEYGDEETWMSVYGGSGRAALLTKLRGELDFAERAGASYVVFHVAECTLSECFTYQFYHSDEEICDSACEVINALLGGKAYPFQFLVENLWWSGFTMTDRRVTKRLLDGIHTASKGIMLDTGHLLHTNRSLRTQEEGIAYINRLLDEHGELCGCIKGVHLQQSLSGEYVEETLKTPWIPAQTYSKRLMQAYPHIFRIDRHKPFTGEGAAELIRRLQPDYLTFELISADKAEHERALAQQLEALGRQGLTFKKSKYEGGCQ